MWSVELAHKLHSASWGVDVQSRGHAGGIPWKWFLDPLLEPWSILKGSFAQAPFQWNMFYFGCHCHNTWTWRYSDDWDELRFLLLSQIPIAPPLGHETPSWRSRKTTIFIHWFGGGCLVSCVKESCFLVGISFLREDTQCSLYSTTCVCKRICLMRIWISMYAYGIVAIIG